jgi:hypothetical protein
MGYIGVGEFGELVGAVLLQVSALRTIPGAFTTNSSSEWSCRADWGWLCELHENTFASTGVALPLMVEHQHAYYLSTLFVSWFYDHGYMIGLQCHI